jgi:drug/metabolite transporter (DMT)-like permease
MFTRLVVEEISPSHLVSIRLLLAALLLGPLFINKEELLKMSKVIPSLILLGIINAALPFFLFAWSAQELSAGMLSILNGTSPLFALIIAIILFRQNTTFLQVIGLLAGFIGLLIFIGLDEIRVVFFPVILCLIGAFCYAYSNNVLFNLNHINSSALASATMLSGFIFSIPLFLYEPQSFSFDLSLKTYLATLFLGLVSTGISFIAYVVLLQRSSPVQASSIIFLVPITGIFWGAIFLNEAIDQKVILGSLCILIGIGLTNIFKPKKLLRD